VTKENLAAKGLPLENGRAWREADSYFLKE
jgi:hypothetical protein